MLKCFFGTFELSRKGGFIKQSQEGAELRVSPPFRGLSLQMERSSQGCLHLLFPGVGALDVPWGHLCRTELSVWGPLGPIKCPHSF